MTHSVLIIGAGPVGITTACLLKSSQPSVHIDVIDKRPGSGRSHVLSIQNDATSAISTLLGKAAVTYPNNLEIKQLQNTFKQWNGHNVPTNEIEIQLGKIAQAMGIKVSRDPCYEIQKGDLETLLSQESATALTEKQKTLQPLFTKASVIIAADGARSTVRQDLGIKLTDEETLRHIVELKYTTEGEMQPRGYLEASSFTSKAGYVNAEAVSRRVAADKKTASLFVFANEHICNALLQPDANGNPSKGFYGKTWTFQEIKEKASQNEHFLEIDNFSTRYLRKLEERGSTCSNEKIAILALQIYRSSYTAVNYQNKPILIVGDASSGLILQRGFNKGLKESALCAQAIDTYFKSSTNQILFRHSNDLAKYFTDYQHSVAELFRTERSTVYLKNMGIKISQSSAKSSAISIESMDSTFSSNNFFLWLASFLPSSSKDSDD